VCKSCGEGDDKGWFHGVLEWKVGKGNKIKFRVNVLCGGSSLQSMFPRLYSLSLYQRKLFSEVGGWENEVWVWRLNWRRVRYCREEEQVDDMLTLISRVSLNKETRDSQVWGVEASGIFSVRSAYTRLAKFDYITHNLVFKQLWQSKAFSNALITAWRVLLDRMPIRSCLARRGVVNPLICMVC